MAMKDRHNTVSESVAFDSATIGSNTTTTGATIDMNDVNGFESLEVVVVVSSHTDGDFALSYDESDNGSSWAAAAADDVLGASSLVADGTGRLGYVGKKQFARLSIVSTSVTTGATLAAVAVRGDARHNPTA